MLTYILLSHQNDMAVGSEYQEFFNKDRKGFKGLATNKPDFSQRRELKSYKKKESDGGHPTFYYEYNRGMGWGLVFKTLHLS